MKKALSSFLCLLLCGIMTLTFTACSTGSRTAIDNEPEKDVTGESKILVAYFSWSGNTQQLAGMIAQNSGGELFRIVPQTAYPTGYSECADRAKSELDTQTRPTLSSHIDEAVMAEYDVIFIGYPVWWYDLPMSVWTFLEEYDLSGKTIIPFFTHNGSSSGAGSRTTIQTLCPNSTVLTGDYFSVNGNDVEAAETRVSEWLQRLGYSL